MINNFDQKNSVILKSKRDSHVRNKHPWVFMGAIESYPDNYQNGSIVAVASNNNEFLGYGYFHQGQSISGRMLSFNVSSNPEVIIVENLHNALELRKSLNFEVKGTNAYRLVNAEADFLPGLVVDKYDKVLVLQFNTLGINLQKDLIVKALLKAFPGVGIYEKSASPTRRKEKLEDFEGWLANEQTEPLVITENGLKFSVRLSDSQKTGFFLDQREMRNLVKGYALEKKVLNCFSYTGGFSIYALSGGAEFADSIDISESAVGGVKINLELNNFSDQTNLAISADVLDYFNQRKHIDEKSRKYDFIILDPPAFAKRSSDIKNATRGYREINRAALQALPQGGLLLTSSCSAHIDKSLFQTIIFQAAKDAKRNIRILSYHALAADHPVSLFYPEGDYLKSLLLYVE